MNERYHQPVDAGDTVPPKYYDLSMGLSRPDIIGLFPRRVARNLKVPALEMVQWDMYDYFGWYDLQTRTGYMVAPYRGDVKGLVLEPTRSSQMNIIMCDLCGITHNPRQACLYSTITQDPRKRIGKFICTDLCCSEYIRGMRNPTRLQPSSSVDPTTRVLNLQENLERYLDQIYCADK